jgi:hypothetical protein
VCIRKAISTETLSKSHKDVWAPELPQHLDISVSSLAAKGRETVMSNVASECHTRLFGHYIK